MSTDIVFAPYGEPPDGPNNPVPTHDWPAPAAGTYDKIDSRLLSGLRRRLAGGALAQTVLSNPSEETGSDAASIFAPSGSNFLAAEPGSRRGPRSYITTASKLNVRQDTDQKSIVSLFSNTSGPGAEVSRAIFTRPELILLFDLYL